MLAAALALLGKFALDKLLPKLLGALGDGLVSYLTNFVDAQGQKVTAREGAELMKRLQPIADRVVVNIEREMPEAEGKTKQDEAFVRLGRELLVEFETLTTRQLNMMIEVAVQKLPQ